MANFGINGFGRIGRNVLRAMSQDQVAQVKAINDLTDTHTLAHLLKWDSVHGKFDGEIGYDDENIIVRGQKIRILKERDPAKLPWRDLGVDVVLESTGFFTSREKAELHIAGGAKKVLISAPGEKSGRDHLPRDQRRHLRRREDEHHLKRELHHELPRAAGESSARQLHHRERLHDARSTATRTTSGFSIFRMKICGARARRR